MNPIVPRLEWDGPDEEGDWVVYLRGIPNWDLSARGSTRQSALGRLGAYMLDQAWEGGWLEKSQNA